MKTGHEVPPSSAPTEAQVALCCQVIDDSGVGRRIEEQIAARTGRPRALSVRALLVALFVLGIDDRPLHLSAVTRLLFCQLPVGARTLLGVAGEATTTRSFLAAYRRVRYLFHKVCSVMDPSNLPKNHRIPIERFEELVGEMSDEEHDRRRQVLEETLADLLVASVHVASDEELASFDGSLGLDATPVALWSRGRSEKTGLSAADPDGAFF